MCSVGGVRVHSGVQSRPLIEQLTLRHRARRTFRPRRGSRLRLIKDEQSRGVLYRDFVSENQYRVLALSYPQGQEMLNLSCRRLSGRGGVQSQMVRFNSGVCSVVQRHEQRSEHQEFWTSQVRLGFVKRKSQVMLVSQGCSAGSRHGQRYRDQVLSRKLSYFVRSLQRSRDSLGQSAQLRLQSLFAQGQFLSLSRRLLGQVFGQGCDLEFNSRNRLDSQLLGLLFVARVLYRLMKELYVVEFGRCFSTLQFRKLFPQLRLGLGRFRLLSKRSLVVDKMQDFKHGQFLAWVHVSLEKQRPLKFLNHMDSMV